MATTRLTKTFSSSGNRNKWTISLWVKRGKLGSTQTLFACHQNSNYKTRLEIAADDELYFNDEYNGNTNGRIVSNAKLRDTNAWYHIVGIWDKDNSTSDDKIRFYINGSRITSFSDTGNAPSNASTLNVDGQVHEFGSENSGNLFDGAMSHIHFCDGYAYEPTEFGETDATTGEWKIKTSPSVSYGTNGFFILKNGNGVTDQSPNSNDWTVAAGTLTKTEDCPSNVFCTMNPLDNQNQASTFTMGNNKIEWNTNNKTNFATMAVNKGKFYWEMKYANNAGGTDAMTGVCREVSRDGSDWVGHDSHGWSYYASNGNKYTGGSGSSYGNSWTTNNIIGVAFDADTRTLWFSKDGVWQNSATISEIAAGTTTNSAFTNFGTAGEFFFPATSGYDGNKIEFNFGNGYFSTTQITSAGSNASNIGLFEYDVPNNFTALSTKGLNE
tara:strand:+ start:484 stop:1803 length:1320 start_codon:yes stop_codon:yes gene_type:complete